jgi:phosphate/sulfate permease
MSLWPAIILGATRFVSYANGANDNFKGVATLFGSGITDYRKALWWPTVATFAGAAALLIRTEFAPCRRKPYRTWLKIKLPQRHEGE